MSTCNCEKQDGFANCCRVKALEAELNRTVYISDKRAEERDRAETTVGILAGGFGDIGRVINSLAEQNPNGAKESIDLFVDTIQVIGGITTRCLMRAYSHAPTANNPKG